MIGKLGVLLMYDEENEEDASPQLIAEPTYKEEEPILDYSGGNMELGMDLFKTQDFNKPTKTNLSNLLIFLLDLLSHSSIPEIERTQYHKEQILYELKDKELETFDYSREEDDIENLYGLVKGNQKGMIALSKLICFFAANNIELTKAANKYIVNQMQEEKNRKKTTYYFFKYYYNLEDKFGPRRVKALKFIIF